MHDGRGPGPSAREVVRAVIVPFVLSRVLVIAALGLTREVVRDLATSRARSRSARASRVGRRRTTSTSLAAATTRSATDGLRFFPLFPLLGACRRVVPGVDAKLATLLVANASAFALGFVLYRLAWFERRDEAFARRAGLARVPAAAGVRARHGLLGSDVHAARADRAVRRSAAANWWVAAVAGLLAGACRPIGLLLAVPALVEAVQHRRALDARDIAARVAAVVAPVLGCFAYLSWAADRTDELPRSRCGSRRIRCGAVGAVPRHERDRRLRDFVDGRSRHRRTAPAHRRRLPRRCSSCSPGGGRLRTRAMRRPRSGSR